MADVARHVRIFDKEPTDDLVTKRTKTISSIAEKFLKLKNYDDYFQIGEDIARALESESFELPNERVSELEAAIQAESPAFNREGQNLQMLTCLMLGALTTVQDASLNTTSWGRPEIVASSLWLALGIQVNRPEAKIEALRAELLEAARSLIQRSAETARMRTPVPDPAVKVAELTEAKIAEGVNKGLLKSIEILRQNAALDREELDLLWWALGDWSVLQSAPYKTLPLQVAAITAGVEVSELLRRLPSEGHKHVALRQIVDDSDRDAAEFVGAMGNGSQIIRSTFATYGYIQKFPHVFQLMASIAGEQVKTQAIGNRSWGARAMLEAIVLRRSQNNETVI
jgi:hypothetical protein